MVSIGLYFAYVNDSIGLSVRMGQAVGYHVSGHSRIDWSDVGRIGALEFQASAHFVVIGDEADDRQRKVVELVEGLKRHATYEDVEAGIATVARELVEDVEKPAIILTSHDRFPGLEDRSNVVCVPKDATGDVIVAAIPKSVFRKEGGCHRK